MSVHLSDGNDAQISSCGRNTESTNLTKQKTVNVPLELVERWNLLAHISDCRAENLQKMQLSLWQAYKAVLMEFGVGEQLLEHWYGRRGISVIILWMGVAQWYSTSRGHGFKTPPRPFSHFWKRQICPPSLCSLKKSYLMSAFSVIYTKWSVPPTFGNHPMTPRPHNDEPGDREGTMWQRRNHVTEKEPCDREGTRWQRRNHVTEKEPCDREGTRWQRRNHVTEKERRFYGGASRCSVTHIALPGKCSGCPGRWGCVRCRSTDRRPWTGRTSAWETRHGRGCEPSRSYPDSERKMKDERCLKTSLVGCRVSLAVVWSGSMPFVLLCAHRKDLELSCQALWLYELT